MKQNKNHWYDGWFYDVFIAPNQDRLFSLIKTIIEPNSSVLDVGCGTGRFPFTIADKSKSVLGIDLSTRNIEKAKSNLAKNPNAIGFLVGQVMKETKGKADPKSVNELIRKAVKI